MPKENEGGFNVNEKKREIKIPEAELKKLENILKHLETIDKILKRPLSNDRKEAFQIVRILLNHQFDEEEKSFLKKFGKSNPKRVAKEVQRKLKPLNNQDKKQKEEHIRHENMFGIDFDYYASHLDDDI